ncbi:MAG: PEP/pyruvate-binding domain-containing protein [Anaerolineales bacterium]
MSSSVILSLNSHSAQLDIAGGKGANLSKLALAGFQVPGGFIITTPAYQLFLEINNLVGKIQDRILEIQLDDPASLQVASIEIRSWFSSGDLSSGLNTQIIEAYKSLNGIPVAVRSSATAEDLPGYSFAGQQDTFLNIVSEPDLLIAIVDCWSSLWTARAIGYRARNEIPQDQVALAVVVQEMVPAEASGVMFTANPLSGSRREAVIDATLGLGEALVAGHVEPDHYVVNLQEREILAKTLGSKQVAIYGKAGGGVLTEEVNAASRQALPDQQILILTDLGRQITEIFDFPQDIEWAWAGEQLYILQSRPITSLFPIPEEMDPDPLRIMFSFASVQGIMEPFTPLGQDTIRMIFAGGGSLFGYDLTHETQGAIKIAGERLWGDATAVIRHPIGSRIIGKLFSVIDPGLQPIFDQIWDEPGLGRGTGHLRFSTFRSLAGFIFPFLRRVLGYMRSPDGAAEQIHQDSLAEIDRLRVLSEHHSGEQASLSDRLDLYRQIYSAFPYAVPHIASGAAGGLIPLFVLNKLASHLTGSWDLALEITRGLPNNVTTQMDLDLWETARLIRSDSDALKLMTRSTSANLAAEYMESRLPDSAQKAIELFLLNYGMRGLGEIDIGRPRWNEDPTHIMEVIRSYLQIEDESLAPDAVFQRGAQASEKAIAELASLAKGTFGGRLKSKFVHSASRRVRALAGLRESPKFHIIQMMWVIRQALLESGQELVSSGNLQRVDDLFFLYLNELEALAQGVDQDWQTLVSERRASYQREMSRVQLPRLLLSDGRAYYDGLTAEDGDGSKLKGSPVSPGVVEGLVRVVLDPLNANLSPGEILVCQGTDPAWTPLFLAAGGLVMEVGGMMTHGAIVAREYGIPAVVGVHQATTVLQTGRRIQVNGSSGEIQLQDS